MRIFVITDLIMPSLLLIFIISHECRSSITTKYKDRYKYEKDTFSSRPAWLFSNYEETFYHNLFEYIFVASSFNVEDTMVVQKNCLKLKEQLNKNGIQSNLCCNLNDFCGKFNLTVLDKKALRETLTVLLDAPSKYNGNVITNNQYVSESLNGFTEVDMGLYILMAVIFLNTEIEPNAIDIPILTFKLMARIISTVNIHRHELAMSCKNIKGIISVLLMFCDILLERRQEMVAKASVNGQETLQLKEMVNVTTRLVVTLWEDMMQTLCSCAGTGENEIVLKTTKSYLWIKAGRSYIFKNTSAMLEQQNSFFKISPLLADQLSQDPGLVSVQFMTTKANLFWQDFKDSKSVKNLILLSIKRNYNENVKNLSYPIDLYFKYNEKTIPDYITNGFAYIIPIGRKTEDKDSYVLVYKLNQFQMSGSGKVFVKFSNLRTHRFKVLILQNAWPDYQAMSLNSREVSCESPCYEADLYNQTNDVVNYLGILAVPNVTGGRAAYSFEVRYIQCHSTFEMKWMNDGCHVGNKTNEEVIHCQCWHLSIFGGSVAISPKQMDLGNNLQLLLEVNDNPKTFIVVFSLIVIYLMVLVWTRHNDGKDQLQRFVIVLEDNFPGEEWSYLITVYTGFWIGAGTDANVGFRLYGSKGFSRVHNLQTIQRKVLKGNCDDWFLIFTPRSLGEIEKIYVFHDNSGPSPDWYCKKIMVYDLKNQKDFLFIVEKWISVSEEDECIDVFAEPTPTQKSLRRDRIAIDNVLFGLRETHLLISIFTRHPRSSVTRSQRLSVCVCILMVHMLTSIMFYKLEGLEFPEYSDTKRKIIIDMESTLLYSPFTFLVIFCFKKSRIVTPPKSDVPMTLTSTQAVPLETGLEMNQSKTFGPSTTYLEGSDVTTSTDSGSSSSSSYILEEEVVEEEPEEVEGGCVTNCYQQFRALLFQVIVSKAVMPVRIAEEDEDSSRVRKQWMYFAWFLCVISIFLSALFVVLYSMKLEEKSINPWMEEYFRNSFGNILLMAPLKIIIFATILAVLYGQLQYIPSYECNTEIAMKKMYIGNEWFLGKVLKKRSNECYHSLNSKKKTTFCLQEKNWRRWRIIITFIVVLLLYAVLTFEVVFTWSGLYFETFRHLQLIFHPDLLRHSITSFANFTEYLHDIVIPALEQKTWYNGVDTLPKNTWKKEMSYASDYSNRVFAFTRLRQQRVKGDSCKVLPIMSKSFSQCNAPMTLLNTDTSAYSSHWTQPEKISIELNSPWVFSKTKPWPNGPLLICGDETRKCYLPGGYIAKFDYNSTSTHETIKNLLESEWFDGLTRVVFFEIVLYNINTDIIGYVTLMLERLYDGSFHFSVKESTLHPRSTNFTPTITVIFMFTFYYCLRIVLLFNRKGLGYLFSWTGQLDLFVNGLLYFTMVSLCFYQSARVKYIHLWHEGQEDDLQMTGDIFLHRDLVKYETAILAIIIPTQLLHNFRFGKKCFLFFKGLKKCLYISFNLILLVSISYAAFMLMNAINNTRTAFCSPSRLYSLLSFIHVTDNYTTMMGFKLFTVLFLVVTNISAYFCSVSTIFDYREVKVYYKQCDDFNMYTFIGKKLTNSKLALFNLKRYVTSTARKRFRGGADDTFIEDYWPRFSNRNFIHTKQMCCDLNLGLETILENVMRLDT